MWSPKDPYLKSQEEAYQMYKATSLGTPAVTLDNREDHRRVSRAEVPVESVTYYEKYTL